MLLGDEFGDVLQGDRLAGVLGEQAREPDPAKGLGDVRLRLGNDRGGLGGVGHHRFPSGGVAG
ncbi:hypothetical protein ACWD4X_31290 [Streptomyces termitum]